MCKAIIEYKNYIIYTECSDTTMITSYIIICVYCIVFIKNIRSIIIYCGLLDTLCCALIKMAGSWKESISCVIKLGTRITLWTGRSPSYRGKFTENIPKETRNWVCCASSNLKKCAVRWEHNNVTLSACLQPTSCMRSLCSSSGTDLRGSKT